MQNAADYFDHCETPSKGISTGPNYLFCNTNFCVKQNGYTGNVSIYTIGLNLTGAQKNCTNIGNNFYYKKKFF